MWQAVDSETILLEFVAHESTVSESDNRPEWERFRDWICSNHPELNLTQPGFNGLWALLWATAQEDGPKMNLFVNRVVRVGGDEH